MEMCYDGALVMPSSYAVMSEDEMTYVEGGAVLSWSAVTRVGAGIIAIFGAVGAVFGAMNNVIKFGATVKGMTESAFASYIGAKVSGALTRLTAWISKYAGVIACVALTIAAAVGGFAFGYTIGKRIYRKK